MRFASFAGKRLPVLTFLALAATSPLQAQSQATATQPPATPPLTHEQIVAFAKMQIAIDSVRERIQFQLPMAGNKTHEAQLQLQEEMRKGIEEILHHNGLTEAEYKRKVFLVGTHDNTRKTYDSLLVALTGVALPGAVRPEAAGGRGGGAGAATPVAVPAGAVGVHVGHVMNGFTDTPNGAGLLPTALAEAAIASNHATLGARTPEDLTMMQLHAGHVLHALDPTVVMMGPGQGYGVKKAATGVASHIELAAAAEGASATHRVHAGHVAMSARNTARRTDLLVELLKQVRTATTAAQAAALYNQIVPLAQALVAGADGNGDGRITWEEGEGGLQQAQEHVMLLLGGAAQ